MRVITGSARGTNLETLEGEATRPTLQRAKEAIFSAIQFDLDGRYVLDLFAGSGQMGLEALSRGADKCVFCDNSQQAIEIIRQNALKTHLYQKCKILKYNYDDYIRAAAVSGHKFSLVFLDPPYDSDYAEKALCDMIHAGILASHAVVIVESDRANLLTEKSLQYYTVEKTYKSGRTYFYKLALAEENGGAEI